MKRSHLFLYILLNVIVSAVTTLAVITVLDRSRKAEIPPLPQAMIDPQVAGANIAEGTGEGSEPAAPEATPTLPPIDQPVIEIISVVGAGDLETEMVLLKRVGEGNLLMTGWRLEGSNGSTYEFPEQPRLVLYKDGAVQFYSRQGENSATEVFWNRSNPAWQSGETVRLIDIEGNERATYQVP